MDKMDKKLEEKGKLNYFGGGKRKIQQKDLLSPTFKASS